MRILVLGAGAIGGYYGGRLVEKGEDVTFLVRPKRKEHLEKNGLRIQSYFGDFSFQPKCITSNEAAAPFDLVLFSTKAYHLEDAMNDLKPYVGEHTVILPLLNGVAHFNRLKEVFGVEKVIGGLCFIETTLNHQGIIEQTSAIDRLVYGEFDQKDTERIREIEKVFSGTKATFSLSAHIEQEIWQKYLFITVMSGCTSLMRAPIGPIRESIGGEVFIKKLFKEVESIIKKHGGPLREDIVDKQLEMIRLANYDMKSSMQRDMEKGLSIEGQHLQGFLLQLAKKYQLDTPYLLAVYQNLVVYETMLGQGG
ncbi:ketopantoate reductase family protein [Sporosarcina pasteurii]|uniref:2-dehydropantoate 2-reductase n=1 Tax=Sporosarcina pasteurii TaxID=1474 RepID=A0A380C451_SPOPA|nr:ketopantoate reductase family protein [Sporosarcina pasteurii]MDS9471594.1 ketopantoate reductase family protein [Sporosarcina pasteurii]QBQ04792.1 ketopantoate reductase family protein [Sporosarcina pasteurii]SUJ11235.1 2-dehydropantoate 2-reductase [Sporosarcina pasteurii]